jgi:hypothetical protein
MDLARCAGFDVPEEEGWFFVGKFGVGLPVEDAGQEVTAALSGAHPENDVSLHGPPVEEKGCRGSAAPGRCSFYTGRRSGCPIGGHGQNTNIRGTRIRGDRPRCATC